MEKEEFKTKMEDIFTTGYRLNIAHESADDLMVETLKSLGYDLTAFEKATKWYD